MSSEELYFNFQLILNKNASLSNVSIPRSRFVVLYNREALNWLEDYISNSSTQKIHNIQGLLSVNKLLNLNKIESGKYYYDLPEKYFEFVGSYSEAVKEPCVKNVYNYLQKPKELQTVVDNESPSFEFEESVCNITENKLEVYTENYKINNTYLSYYHKPEKIDLSGYTNINNGVNSETIDTTLDERYQSQIIDRVVLEVMREFENTNGMNISQNRVQNNEK